MLSSVGEEEGRNFRLLHEEELPQLLDFLAEYLPESLKFHQTLLTYMRNRVWKFHFYVAHDWPKDPICLHLPGMAYEPDMLHSSFGVFCPSTRLDLLRLVKEEDVLIEWWKMQCVNFVHSDIADELIRLYDGEGVVDKVYGDVWACEDTARLEQLEDENVEDDEDVQLLPLKPEHAVEIHKLYPANLMECRRLFRRLIRTLPAVGVFVNGNLAAWMIQSYYGAMFSMQTKPQYRRKGYGTKLARYLTKRVMEMGYQPFVVIRPENVASQSLYTKLGFRKLYQMVRMKFLPTCVLGTQDQQLGDMVENAVRQLKRDNYADDEEPGTASVEIEDVECDETIDETETPASGDALVEEPSEHGVESPKTENGFVREEEVLEPIAEQPEERIDVAEVSELPDEVECAELSDEECAKESEAPEEAATAADGDCGSADTGPAETGGDSGSAAAGDD